MSAKAVHVYFAGNVQGVGFRYTCRHLAKGFEITGWVRNLDDGRVELWAQGEETEVREFLNAIDESHLKGLIRKTAADWTVSEPGLIDFSITH